VIDSQSVKAPSAEKRGPDAGKKVVGRKRHIAVDADGRLLMVHPTTADLSDSAGAQIIPRAAASAGRGSSISSPMRRLVRDYERRVDASNPMILVAMGGNLLRRTPIHDCPNGLSGLGAASVNSGPG